MHDQQQHVLPEQQLQHHTAGDSGNPGHREQARGHVRDSAVSARGRKPRRARRLAPPGAVQAHHAGQAPDYGNHRSPQRSQTPGRNHPQRPQPDLRQRGVYCHRRREH